jgi:hypothetical protein
MTFHAPPCTYTTLKFLALQEAPHINDISRLRINTHFPLLEQGFLITIEINRPNSEKAR